MTKRPAVTFSTIIISTLFFYTSCSSVNDSIKNAKYSAYEMVGYEKRDLFKNEVNTVKENQKDSQEAFEDSLEKLKHFYAFDGGKVEKEYKKLKSSYEKSQKESENLSSSIQKLNTVAQDLFTEWNKEINEMNSAELKRSSGQKLTETKNKYSVLYKKLKTSEAKMPPLLSKIKDQVTYLKHNLNASAISGLKNEGNRIEKDIQKLIEDMSVANKEAEEFIKTL